MTVESTYPREELVLVPLRSRTLPGLRLGDPNQSIEERNEKIRSLTKDNNKLGGLEIDKILSRYLPLVVLINLDPETGEEITEKIIR